MVKRKLEMVDGEREAEKETIDGWMDKADRRHKQPGGAGPAGNCALGLKSAEIWRKSCSHEEGKQRGRESWGVWRGNEWSLDDC